MYSPQVFLANIILYFPSLTIRYKMILLVNFLANECHGSFMQQINILYLYLSLVTIFIINLKLYFAFPCQKITTKES